MTFLKKTFYDVMQNGKSTLFNPGFYACTLRINTLFAMDQHLPPKQVAFFSE